MLKNNKRKKEEIAEDCCFLCKEDGGSMRICDFRDCLKAYHPLCLGEDDSFLEKDFNWGCGHHYCSRCRKASNFSCFCCPVAVCGSCLHVSDFAVIKGSKGFCRRCSTLAVLIEENADADSDGEKIDFKDPDYYESYFSRYYEIIKKKEGLNAFHVHCARNIIRIGKNKHHLDPCEIGEGEDDTGESDDGSDFICQNSNGTSRVKSMSGKKKRTKKLKSTKGTVKVKDKRKEFIGWGSRSLIEFLKFIGKDTSREFSERDVASIIIEYCTEKKLFDPEKKKKVICDAQLRSLLGRKSVNRNNIHNLLALHFVENYDEMDDITSGSEVGDDNEPFESSKPGKVSSNTKSCQNLVSVEHQSCFAAIVSSNIKLVYLKRSLINDLLKEPETFDSKVLGSFVRIKSDPNDYLQKNSHLLQQVAEIKRFTNKDGINKEILLRLSNVPKDVPFSKISDDDFSEEECQDLYQRMRNGLIKQPTTLELEQKARTLHEDIMKHWIPRELALLQIRIEQANEKGWRRELSQYMDRKLMLENPSEQSRLLKEIPKVVPDDIDTNLSPEHSSGNDKFGKNHLPELAIEDTCNSVGQYSQHDDLAQCLDKITDVVGPKTPINQDGTPFHASAEQLSNHTELTQYASDVTQDYHKAMLVEELNPNPAKRWLSQPSHTETVSGADGTNQYANRNGIQTNDVVVLSDSDDEDANVKGTTAGSVNKKLDNPNISNWHCSGPFGERRGPFPMYLLKRWSESTPSPEQFKVWKDGHSESEAIPLIDALRQVFPQHVDVG